jgi:hypothetical protein
MVEEESQTFREIGVIIHAMFLDGSHAVAELTIDGQEFVETCREANVFLWLY